MPRVLSKNKRRYWCSKNHLLLKKFTLHNQLRQLAQAVRPPYRLQLFNNLTARMPFLRSCLPYKNRNQPSSLNPLRLPLHSFNNKQLFSRVRQKRRRKGDIRRSQRRNPPIHCSPPMSHKTVRHLSTSLMTCRTTTPVTRKTGREMISSMHSSRNNFASFRSDLIT